MVKLANLIVFTDIVLLFMINGNCGGCVPKKKHVLTSGKQQF